MTIRNWSTTPSANNSEPPNGWPEGMAPSGVNNAARQMMADIRETFEQLPYLDLGHIATRIDTDTFTIPTDLTATYIAGIGLKLVGTTTEYVSVASSSYSAPDTTVNVNGVVPTSLTTVSIGMPGARVRYDITEAEQAALVTPVNYFIPSHDVVGVALSRRYGTIGDGVYDDTAGLVNCFSVAKAAGCGMELFAEDTYLVSGGFGTSSTVTDFADNVFIDGKGSTIKVNATAIPNGTTYIIRLEGNNVAVRNVKFSSTVEFEQYNTDPLSYRTKTIVGILIGGKAASYTAVTDSLTYYKKRATVEWCDFENIHSPIIATQSSIVRILNNYIYSYNASALVVWGCPYDILVDGNHVKLGADDAITVGMQDAARSAWITAGNEAGFVRITNNYAGFTRARPIGTGGYSDVLIADNQCEMSMLNGIAIFGDPTLFAEGSLYNRNIVIDNNTIKKAGRFYDTTSAYAYWTGPVSQENSAIGTYAYKGTRGVDVLPRDITITNNHIENPSGGAFYLHSIDGVRIEGNTSISGTFDQGAGNVNTNGSVYTSISALDVLIERNYSYPGNGVAWNYTYSISSLDLSAGDVRIRGNTALDAETYDPANENPTGLLINAYEYTASFNPAIYGSTAAGEGTYTTRTGQFTKIGNRVYFNIYILWTAHTGTGNLLVSQLPYLSDATAGTYSAFSIYHSDIALTAGNTMQAFLSSNSTTINICQVATGGGSATTVPIDAAGTLIISGNYPVAI